MQSEDYLHDISKMQAFIASDVSGILIVDPFIFFYKRWAVVLFDCK